MTKKEYLSQAFYLDRKIKAKERQLEAIRCHAEYSSPKTDGEFIKSRSVQSALEESAVKIIELENYVSNQIKELVRLKAEIEQVIKSVGNIEYETVLEMRYLSFMDWKEISARMEYGGKYVFRVHGRALELIRLPSNY